MIFEEKTISSEMIYKGAILNLRKDTVEVVGNRISHREIIEHNGGVTIAAVTDDNKMVLVKQFRKAVEKVILEVPAGKRDGDEEYLETAKRELKEETGYTAKNIKMLTKFYSSVGYSEELIYAYLCTGLTPGETDFDDNEAIDVVEYDIDELYKMIMNGEIADAKTIVTVLMAIKHLSCESTISY
jgi:ADP-ribose pyrophosphatase